MKDITLLAFCATSADLKEIIAEGCSKKYDTFVIVKVLETLQPLCLYKPKRISEKPSSSLLVDAFKEFMRFNYENSSVAAKDHLTELVSSPQKVLKNISSRESVFFHFFLRGMVYLF